MTGVLLGGSVLLRFVSKNRLPLKTTVIPAKAAVRRFRIQNLGSIAERPAHRFAVTIRHPPLTFPSGQG